MGCMFREARLIDAVCKGAHEWRQEGAEVRGYIAKGRKRWVGPGFMSKHAQD